MVVLKYSEHSFFFFPEISDNLRASNRRRERETERLGETEWTYCTSVSRCTAVGCVTKALSSLWVSTQWGQTVIPLAINIALLSLQTNISVKESFVCVWNSGVKFTADYSLIHYAEWVLNYVKQRVREKGDLHCKVTIWGGAQEGHSGDEGMFWLVRSCLTLREASRPWNARKHHRGQHVALV